jgi:streptogramin lyase
MNRRRAIAAVTVLAIVAVASFAVYELFYTGGLPCGAIPAGSVARIQTSETHFGAVTEYQLPGVDRYPNAVAAASDGSVWFAEDEAPGVAHLFPNNGTVVQYAWPNYPTPQPPDCSFSASVSGLALWNGRVWGADEYGNVIIGVNPSDGKSVSLNTSAKADYPYWLAVGPDGDLWFTSDNTPARLGRIFPNMSVQIFNLSGLGNDEPLTLDFVNSSLAYISTVNISTFSPNSACAKISSNCASGHVYSFDPSNALPTMMPKVVGAAFNLTLPTSASFSGGSLWVAQHDASNVMRYDIGTGTWTTYPTSTVAYVPITLSLETAAEGGNVWFNEHYANKIGAIDPASNVLTEYSESNPPISNGSEIQNDLSIGVGRGGVWFTSLSGNYIGFVNGTYDPGWRVAVAGEDSATTLRGGNASFAMSITGNWSSPLGVGVSDSENLTSTPKQIRIVPSVSSVPASGATAYELDVKAFVPQTVLPGDYTLAVTLTSGVTQQSVYFFVKVS